MIVEKTTVGVQYIPVVENGRIIKHIQLLGGNNEVDDKLWAKARQSLLGHLKRKQLIEKFVNKIDEEVTEADVNIGTDKKPNIVKGQKKTYKISAKQFNKLEAKEAIAIVENTYDMKTLKKWQEESGKESVSAALASQIKKIEDHKVKKSDAGKKKKGG